MGQADFDLWTEDLQSFSLGGMIQIKYMSIAAGVLLVLLCKSGDFAHAATKYGAFAEPLSARTHDAYFKKKPAPDFWALIPYYTGQTSGQQCSAASLVMVLNAMRVGKPLTADEPLITIVTFLEKYVDAPYRKFMTLNLSTMDILAAIARGEMDRSVIGSKNLARILGFAIEKLELKKPETRVELVLIDRANIEKSRRAFHEALIKNEKSARDFIVLSSFVQGTLTSDPEGPPHVAPIGAYDAEKRSVLILDPDREWYEPYWVSEDKVFEAIVDPRSDHANPGWISVTAQ